jgi:Uma2 family endonuclease
MGTVDTTLTTCLTTWDGFLQLPDGPEGTHCELHDGEVVVMPPPRPVHVYVQGLLVEWLTAAARGLGRAAMEFPYRPALNLQFWYADVAYLPNEDWLAMRGQDYPVYAPPLVIEVLSPSNKPEKIRRQRIAAFSGGTEEFWVVGPVSQTVEVSLPGQPSRVYRTDEMLPVTVLPGASFLVGSIFRE